jgi:hypothetical protein
MNPDTLDGLLAQIPALPADPVLRGAIIGVAFLVLALVVRLLVKPVLHRLTSRTDSDLDDRLADHLIQPAFWATIAAGLWFAQAPLALGEGTRYWISGALLTVIIVQWSVAILKVGMTLLEALSQRPGGTRWVQPATQPLFEIVLKFVLAGGAVYFVCVAWDIPGHQLVGLGRHHRYRRRLRRQGHAREPFLRCLHPGRRAVQDR